MLDPIDRARCSFPVPDFASADAEAAWVATLTPEQRMELLYLAQLARYGTEAVARGIDRTHVELLSIEEFDRRNAMENQEEEHWWLDHGWPPRMPALREKIVRGRGDSTNRGCL